MQNILYIFVLFPRRRSLLPTITGNFVRNLSIYKLPIQVKDEVKVCSVVYNSLSDGRETLLLTEPAF